MFRQQTPARTLPLWAWFQLAAVVVVLLANAAVVIGSVMRQAAVPDAALAAVSTNGRAAPTGDPIVGAAPPPVRVSIPAIGVESDLIRLGLADNGELEVPKDFGTAGWYQGGPSPGEPGAAVVVGHLDSYKGPGVFAQLHTLRRGDRIDIRRADGVRVAFQVQWVSQYPKDNFPTGLVYQRTDGPTLRLITCGGNFDGRERTYDDNVVVFARPVTDVAQDGPDPLR